MFMKKSIRASAALAAFGVGSVSLQAHAGFSTYGTGMDVQTGSITNGQLNVQVVNNLWAGASGSSLPTNTYANAFAGVNCDNYAKAWLVTAIYGGSNLNTAKITASVNGNTLSPLTIGNAGGVNDANANAYGSSVAGIWVLSLPIDSTYLNKGASATNNISVVVSDKTTGATSPFDGRCYYQSLITLSQDNSLNNILEYAYAVGGGDIGQTSGGYVTSRTLNMGSINSQPITDADLYALYIYGDANQKDALLLNGLSLLGDDVAKKNGTTSYPADFVHADLTASQLLPSNNLLKFTVDSADLSGSLESSLRPEFAVMAVAHSVPEPGSLSLVALGAGLLLKRKRQIA